MPLEGAISSRRLFHGCETGVRTEFLEELMFKNLNTGAIGIRCGWQEALDLAREAGFQGADLDLAAVQQAGPAAVRSAFADRGLRMGGWSFPVRWQGDDAEFYESLSQLPAAAMLAAEVGCFRTMTWVPSWNDERPLSEQFVHARDRFRLAAEILRPHGHRLGLEFLGPQTLRAGHRYDFIHTMDGMLALCAAIGTGNVGLLFDGWHWFTSGGTLEEVRKLCAEDVVYVHLNDAPTGVDRLEQVDNVRCLPGETDVIPNPALLRVLSEVGYDGPLTAEPFNAKLREVAERDPLAAARRTAQSLDQILQAADLTGEPAG
jgi:sugar phosphate isomerase/epimerase